MARSGLYKSDVQMARDALVSQGTRPSVDAVRVALGNTGSKTTIHKYLKELEAEDGGGKRSSISDALQDLVERLAARLQGEAEEPITALRVESDAKANAHAALLQTAQMENSQLRARVVELETACINQGAALAASQAEHQNASTMRQVAEQQVADLVQHLAENQAHRQSLEEKHLHARQALEHYRQSIKEQREGDIRRHEQQVQQVQAELRLAQQTIAVKQGEMISLNQEGATLVAELTHAKQALYEQQSTGRRQVKRIEQLQAIEAQYAGQAAELQAVTERLGSADKCIDELTSQVRERELALAMAQATLAAQQEITADLRSFLSDRAQNSSGGPGGMSEQSKRKG